LRQQGADGEERPKHELKKVSFHNTAKHPSFGQLSVLLHHFEPVDRSHEREENCKEDLINLEERC
jgi:hypothetical protein